MDWWWFWGGGRGGGGEGGVKGGRCVVDIISAAEQLCALVRLEEPEAVRL